MSKWANDMHPNICLTFPDEIKKIDYVTVRDFRLKEGEGATIRRKSRKREQESEIIMTAMVDFHNLKLTVKEFLFLMAARHAPLQCDDGAIDEVFIFKIY